MQGFGDLVFWRGLRSKRAEEVRKRFAVPISESLCLRRGSADILRGLCARGHLLCVCCDLGDSRASGMLMGTIL